MCGLRQLVRGTTHEAGNRLDLVLTNMGDAVKVEVGEKITDHYIVTARFKLTMPHNAEVNREVHDYKHADWHALQHSIIMDPWRELQSGSVHAATASFTERLRGMIATSVPQRSMMDRKRTHP